MLLGKNLLSLLFCKIWLISIFLYIELFFFNQIKTLKIFIFFSISKKTYINISIKLFYSQNYLNNII